MKMITSKWFALSILLAAPLLSVLDVFIINVAVPSIKRGVHANDAEVQLMIALYLLGYASFQITSGRAGDYLGRKKMFMAGMFFFTLTSCICGLSVTPTELIIARFFQGVSAAVMTPQTIAMIQIIFPELGERTKAVGYYGIVMGFATIMGQFLGGYLSNSHFAVPGWRLIFFVNLPIGLTAIVATFAFLKETTKNKSEKLDYYGVTVLTAALFSLIIPLIIGRENGWPVWCGGLFFMSLLLFSHLLKNQRRKLSGGKSPLINMDLFKIKDFNRGIITVVVYFMMHTSYLLIISIYLQDGLKIAPYQNGLFFVVFGLSATVSSFLSIRAVATYGKKVLQAGAAMMLLSFVLQELFLNQRASYLEIYFQMGFYGFGGGIVLPSLLNMALRSVPLKFAGAASGVYATVQQASSALGISIIGGIFYFVINDLGNGPVKYYRAFRYGLYAETACILLVNLLLYLLPQEAAPDPGPAVIERPKLRIVE